MTISLKHATQSTGGPYTPTGELGPEEWNAEHVLTQATSRILGRVTASTGATEELTATQVRTLINVADGATANTGDVTAASTFGTDNRLLRSDGTGKGAQSSSISLDDSGNLYGLNSVASGNYMGISLSLLDSDATHYGTFTLSSNITGSRSYGLSMPDGSYTYTYPAASVTLAAINLEDQTLTGGARVTVKDLGNLSGNTITPDPGDRAIQKITNNGAGTIAPGSNAGCYLLSVINTTGAGAITTSGFTKVDGVFDTTTTSKFHCAVTVTSDYSILQILKVA